MNKDTARKIIKNNYDSEDYYKNVLAELDLEYDFYYKDTTIYNHTYLVKHCRLEPKIIEHIAKNGLCDLDEILCRHQVSEKVIEHVLQSNNAQNIITVQINQEIPINLIQKYMTVLNMSLICTNQFVDLRFLVDNKDSIAWSGIFSNIKMLPKINEGFLILFREYDIWDYVANVNLPLETFLKYTKYFTEETYKGLEEKFELSRDEILAKIES